jgi:hypothetical protein
MKLEEAIVDLLLRHNCVVVPAFGGFIAQTAGAVIDMSSGVMIPPRKSVLFNRQLINNDGLLISYLSSVEGLNYIEAETILKDYVADWHARLQEGKRVSIDKIGHLYLDAERNISFEQDRFFNLLLQSYGLNKVHFIAEEEIKIAEYQHRPEKVQTPIAKRDEEKIDFKPREIPVSPFMPEPAAKIIELHNEPPRKKIWKYAVAAALLPFAFYTYWIPMQTDVLESGMISIKDFNPTYHAGVGVYQQKTFSFPKLIMEKEKTLQESVDAISENLDVYSYRYDDDLFIPVKLRSEKQKPSQKAEKSVSAKVEMPVIEDLLPSEVKTAKVEVLPEVSAKKGVGPQYVVGAYSIMENAKSMVELLRSRGLAGAKILESQGGLIRVSAGGSNNYAEMVAISDKAVAAGYKGWILK